MAKSNNERFLSLYKELEGIFREQGLDWKDVESTSDDMIQNRMRICRQLRNYLSHQNDPSFIMISDTQVKFLEETIDEQRMKGDIVKKHLGTISANTCKYTDKCSDVLVRMIKRKINEMLVYSEIKGKRIIGTVSIFDVSSQVLISKTKKVSDIKSLGDNYIFVSPDMKMEEIPSGKIAYCFDSNDKLIGIVRK